MLGYRFSFEAYAQNVQEKATECSLKTSEIPLHANGNTCLPRFNIYQGTATPNLFKSYTNS